MDNKNSSPRRKAFHPRTRIERRDHTGPPEPFAELELSMIRARVRSGMANARAKVKQIGRPQVGKEDIPMAFLRHYPAYKSGQLNLSEFARVCDLSRTTVYKYLSLLEA